MTWENVGFILFGSALTALLVVVGLVLHFRDRGPRAK